MALRVFLSYSHKDKVLLDKLKTHLAIVRRRGLADFWDDSHLSAGMRFESTIYSQLDVADVILLLISADFLNSEFCYSKEMEHALTRERVGKARVIPVILHDCQWKKDPRLQALTALPRDGLPLTRWDNLDTACANVVDGVFEVLETLAAKRVGVADVPATRARGTATGVPKPSRALPRPADRARFLSEAHAQIARYFEHALARLRTAQATIQTEFTRVDSRTFVCRAVPSGRRAIECAISLVADRGWITFSEIAASRGNIYSECLGVAADERGVFLRCLGLTCGADPLRRLTTDEAAALFWNRFIGVLQA